MTDLATLQTWLTQAEAALHAIQTGTKPQEVVVDGKTVVYNRTPWQILELQRYIADLRARIAKLGGCTADGAVKRTVRRFFVG